MFPFLELGEEGGAKAKTFLNDRKNNEMGPKCIHTTKIIRDKKCSSFSPSLLWKQTEFDPERIPVRYRDPQRGTVTPNEASSLRTHHPSCGCRGRQHRQHFPNTACPVCSVTMSTSRTEGQVLFCSVFNRCSKNAIWTMQAGAFCHKEATPLLQPPSSQCDRAASSPGTSGNGFDD